MIIYIKKKKKKVIKRTRKQRLERIGIKCPMPVRGTKILALVNYKKNKRYYITILTGYNIYQKMLDLIRESKNLDLRIEGHCRYLNEDKLDKEVIKLEKKLKKYYIEKGWYCIPNNLYSKILNKIKVKLLQNELEL